MAEEENDPTATPSMPGDGEPLPPSITGITPVAGALAGGITCTITGRRFQPGAEVYFGVNQSPQVTYESTFKVYAVAPASSQTGSVNVTLVNPDGNEATKAGGFTYVTTEAALHAEVLGVTPSAVIEDTETEVTLRGRNLIDAYTNGMIALRGSTRAAVNVLGFASHVDAASGIEDLIFTLRVTASPPLRALERMAVQVLASRRPGAASDGVFESSSHFFTVLPKAIPVTLAFTPTLEPDRPTLVVVAGRNLEGCTLDFGPAATVYMQKSDDRNVVGVVALPESYGYSQQAAAIAAAPLSMSVRGPDCDEVA